MAAGKSLLDRIRENSSIKETALLTESIIYNEKDIITTQVPMINVAFSGRVDGGLVPGLFELAGPSKHFKSAFGLLLAGAYLKKYSDGVVLFYDSEFGTPHSYFDTFAVDKSRVIHTPITDIEQLKHDIMQQLQGIARGDRLFIFIDSIGALASKKEIEDALKGSDKADFTRAKALKSLFRMVTPHLRIKDIPMVVINHTYKEMTMFPRDIVGGGTGSYYSSDNIWIIGRQQEKDGDDLAGYNFIINIEKSRYVREKSKIPITVTFDGGINKWSGLWELALEAGIITQVKKSSFALVDQKTGEVGETTFSKNKMIDNDVFWTSIFKATNFKDFISNKYLLVKDQKVEEAEPINVEDE